MSVINVESEFSKLTEDEKTILRAFRLFSDEAKDSWIAPARMRIDKELAKNPSPCQVIQLRGNTAA